MSGPPRLRYRRCPWDASRGCRCAWANEPSRAAPSFASARHTTAVRAATGAVPTGTWGAPSRRILTLVRRSHSLRKSRSLRGRVMMHAAVIFNFRPARGFRV